MKSTIERSMWARVAVTSGQGSKAMVIRVRLSAFYLHLLPSFSLFLYIYLMGCCRRLLQLLRHRQMSQFLQGLLKIWTFHNFSEKIHFSQKVNTFIPHVFSNHKRGIQFLDTTPLWFENVSNGFAYEPF